MNLSLIQLSNVSFQSLLFDILNILSCLLVLVKSCKLWFPFQNVQPQPLNKLQEYSESRKLPQQQQNYQFQNYRMASINQTEKRKETYPNNKKQSDELSSGKKKPNTPHTISSRNHQTFDLATSILSSTLQQHPFQCLCKDCNCGRHLCKLQSPSLTLSLASTYQLHYPPRKPYKQRQPMRPTSAKLPETPLLSTSSTYLDNYIGMNGDPLKRPRPEDLMKCERGPSADLTSYKKDFPGHRGKNQYVPMNPQVFRGGLHFSSSSTYSQQYKIQGSKKSQTAKPPDQFRMSGSWFGRSSYSDQFQNPKTHASKGKEERITQSQCSSRSRCSSTGYKNPYGHFRTTYASDFVRDRSVICPAAKKMIEVPSELSKSNFKQNSNFKGMDPKFSSLAKFAF